MTTVKAKRLARGIAIFAILWATPLYARLEVGTWVRNNERHAEFDDDEDRGLLRRRPSPTYSLAAGNQATLMSLETKLDGSEAQVLINGKPSGETMAITHRVDAHHANTIIRMNGKEFATSTATLSADGKTLSVINDCGSTTGCMPIGKSTETWVKQ